MKKFLFILMAALIAITPGLALADTVDGVTGYAQGQQNQTLSVLSQAQLHGPFPAVQVQGVLAGSGQTQLTGNHVDSSVVSGGAISVNIFGFPVLNATHINGAAGQANAAGLNVQGQTNAGIQGQFAFGGFGVQNQTLIQGQNQVQNSFGVSAYHGGTILP